MTAPTGATTPAPDPEAVDPGHAAIRCAQCGEPLEDDQEWCLECGAARTLVHQPPDWRIAGGIIASIALLALVALAIVLINLSGDANSAATAALTDTVTVTAPAPSKAPAPAAVARTTKSATATTPATSTPTPPATGKSAAAAGFAGWSAGLDGWTIVLASTATEKSAVTVAERLRTRGLSVGVFNSSAHPAMRPGRWIVYSGRYPTRAEARADAISLRSRGFESARPAVVGRTGG